MQIVDSHVHLINPGPLRYSWLAADDPLRQCWDARRFAAGVPEVSGLIVVEAGVDPDQGDMEFAWVRLQAAAEHERILGMVVQAPVDHPKELINVLGEIGTHALAVGVRRNLQDEQPGFLHARGLRDGVRALAEFGLPFDACVRSRQLGELDDLAAAARETVIVLNHLGKPRCGDDLARWRKALYGLAARPNLRCKLSGLSTEAAPAAKHADVIAALRTALDAFGADRCLYGGDWPISTRAISGQGWLSLVLQCLEEMGASSTEREDVLSRTAKRTYRFAEQQQMAP